MSVVYPDWSQPVGWLYGFVSTDAPGYRQIKIGATTYTLTADHLSFPELLDDLDTTIGAAGWAAAVDSAGRVTLTGGAAAVIEWPDRLGWLLGFDTEPGDVEASTDTLAARAPSPAAVPLYDVSRPTLWRERERKRQLDRFGRGHGWAYGAARLWQTTVRLHRTGLHALKRPGSERWLPAGRVLLSPFTPAEHIAATATAWSAASPTGYIDGQILGVEGGRWLDATGPRLLHELDLVLATEV